MVAIPEPETTIASLIDDATAKHQEPPRSHLGCSQLGHKCDRKLWIGLRWAVVEKFSGRTLRLFDRGQREEGRVVEWLASVGVVVRDHQARVDFGAHVSGSIDGIIYRGVLGAEKTAHLLEIKTHNLKSFKSLQKDGVKKSKPLHWSQMQVYMLGLKLSRALYFAVCKDDDSIYTERIHLDKVSAQGLVARAKRIAVNDRMPEPLSTYECKWCAGYDLCHGSRLTNQVNCRTCAHATPTDDSTWNCEKYNSEIPFDYQRKGCDAHVLHPDLVPWPRLDCDEDHALYLIEGREVVNGPGHYTSKEIISGPTSCGDPAVEVVREVFCARIVREL